MATPGGLESPAHLSRNDDISALAIIDALLYPSSPVPTSSNRIPRFSRQLVPLAHSTHATYGPHNHDGIAGLYRLVIFLHPFHPDQPECVVGGLQPLLPALFTGPSRRCDNLRVSKFQNSTQTPITASAVRKMGSFWKVEGQLPRGAGLERKRLINSSCLLSSCPATASKDLVIYSLLARQGLRNLPRAVQPEVHMLPKVKDGAGAWGFNPVCCRK
jgi:hypothetical protein